MKHKEMLFLIVKPNGGAEQYTGSIRDLFFYVRNMGRYFIGGGGKVYHIGNKYKCRELTRLFVNCHDMVRFAELSRVETYAALNEYERIEMKQLQARFSI